MFHFKFWRSFTTYILCKKPILSQILSQSEFRLNQAWKVCPNLLQLFIYVPVLSYQTAFGESRIILLYKWEYSESWYYFMRCIIWNKRSFRPLVDLLNTGMSNSGHILRIRVHESTWKGGAWWYKTL